MVKGREGGWYVRRRAFFHMDHSDGAGVRVDGLLASSLRFGVEGWVCSSRILREEGGRNGVGLAGLVASLPGRVRCLVEGRRAGFTGAVERYSVAGGVGAGLAFL